MTDEEMDEWFKKFRELATSGKLDRMAKEKLPLSSFVEACDAASGELCGKLMAMEPRPRRAAEIAIEDIRHSMAIIGLKHDTATRLNLAEKVAKAVEKHEDPEVKNAIIAFLTLVSMRIDR